MSKIPPLGPVKSSLFTGMHYHPDSQALHLEFQNGDIWRYDGVPAEKAATMAESASVGRYFGSKIKGLYNGTKVRG